VLKEKSPDSDRNPEPADKSLIVLIRVFLIFIGHTDIYSALDFVVTPLSFFNPFCSIDMPMRIELTLVKNDNNKTLFLIADLFRLFSRSTPLKILHSLRDKGMTLSEISKSLQMTQKAVLPELTVLQSKDILASFSRSQKTFYRLADEPILGAMDLIHKISLKRARQSETKSPACNRAGQK